MSGNGIIIQAKDGRSFNGYLATPAAGRGPGLLVFHAFFGVKKVIREAADGYGVQGTLLFARP